MLLLRRGQTEVARSYQSAAITFQKAGYDYESAQSLMCKAVKLTTEARRRFLSAHPKIKQEEIRIALSLGPYGATLPQAREFDGLYPPPFGPKEYTDDGNNQNAYEPGDLREEEAERRLLAFHLERLLVFAQHAETWTAIDLIGFETVPLAREVRAIRGAMGKLREEMGRTNSGSTSQKPWWISTVWPDGQFPEERTPGGEHLVVKDVVHALYAKAEYPSPSGIGINCSPCGALGNILDEFNLQICKLLIDDDDRPFLVVYPNHEVQDACGSWKEQTDQDITTWAAQLSDFAHCQQTNKIWSSIMVGGCCNVSPRHIEALAKCIG